MLTKVEIVLLERLLIQALLIQPSSIFIFRVMVGSWERLDRLITQYVDRLVYNQVLNSIFQVLHDVGSRKLASL